MTYFTHVELAERYRISEATVRNWVKMAKDGKLSLVLHIEGSRSYIANVPGNMPVIENLVKTNKKYRNTLSSKTITPKPAFYKTFTEKQIYEIVRNLEAHHEIPRQYNYFDGGADEWDVYTQRLAGEHAPNLLNRTVKLLTDNQSYLDQLLSKYKHINVIDIGPGNALPVKAFLNHLLQQKKLSRYIAIDISAEMLQIAKQNIKEWFNDRVTFEKLELDITHERFGDILVQDYSVKDAKDTCNVVLFLGGTAYNFRNPGSAFWTIHESMNANDILIYTDKIETEETRPQWFDYNVKPGKLSLTPMHRLVFDMLSIDDSLYDVEMGFNKKLGQHYTLARFKVALNLKFKFKNGERIIALEKGDTILLWRSWQITAQNFLDQFERNEFYVAHTSQTDDHRYVMTIAQILCE